MNNTEINIKIHTLQGGLVYNILGYTLYAKDGRPRPISDPSHPIDYCNDLNACARFEATLRKDGRWCDYLDFLFPADDNEVPYETLWKFVSATARQRCESYLKTIDKWEETTAN